MTAAERMAICKQCPLYKRSEYGPVCNSNKWINENGDVSLFKKEGYVKGCGCKLRQKTRNPDMHCIVNKW